MIFLNHKNDFLSQIRLLKLESLVAFARRPVSQFLCAAPGRNPSPRAVLQQRLLKLSSGRILSVSVLSLQPCVTQGDL